LIKNDIWRATVKPKDGIDFGNISYSSNITVKNTPPSASNLDISPSDPTTENDLTLTYAWIDSDPVDIELNSFIQWYLDNGSGFVLQTEKTNQTTIPSSLTKKNDKWMCNVTPSDGEGFGTSKLSSVIIIKNSLPILTVKINGYNTSANIDNDTNLDASYDFYDADNDSPNATSVESRWWRFTGGSWDSFSNDTLMIVNGSTNVNDYWYVEIRISDGFNYSEWFSSASVIIEGTPNSPPVATDVNLTLSNPIAEGFLNISYTYSDADGDNEALTTYRWFKNGILQSQYDGIWLLSISFVKGDNWTAEVKPQDDKNDYGNWTASETITIGNTAPSVTLMEIYPSEAYTTDTLIASTTGYDIDGDSILHQNSRIVWWNGSIEVTSLENSTEVPSYYTRKGQGWKYQVWLFDGENWSISKNSSIITIKNSIPTVENVKLLGGRTSDEDIILSYDFIDVDNDTDMTTVTWFVGITSIPSSKILSKNNFIAGNVIFCIFDPDDGDEEGETVISSTWPEGSIEVGNSPPVLISPPNIIDSDGTTFFTVTTNIVVNYSVFDIDETEANHITYGINPDENGIIEGALYRWYKNGALIFEGTDIIKVDKGDLKKGDTWKVSVRPIDNYNTYGIWHNSSEIIILNSPRVVVDIWFVENQTEIIIENSTNVYVNILTQYSTDDPDHTDVLQDIDILWYLNNGSGSFVLRGDLLNQTLVPSSELQRGQQWYVSIRVFDGTEWSEYLNKSIQIVNSLPSIAAYEFLYKDDSSIINRIDRYYIVGEDIVLTYDFEDLDNDLNLTSIRWFKQLNNGSWIEMTEFENMTVVSNNNTQAGDLWYASIIPHDGIDEGVSVNSSYINVISRPLISEHDSEPDRSMDGKYNLTVKVTDFSNPQTLVVTFQIISINSTKYLASYLGSGYWNLSVNLIEWLNTSVTVNVEAYSTIDSTFHIFSYDSFDDFTILDKAPPRVTKISYLENKETNPTYIEFFIAIEELGSEIKEVILFYNFSEIDSSSTGFGSQLDEELSIKMEFYNNTNGIVYYYVKLDLSSFDQDVILSYTVQTEDQLGNRNPNAFSDELRLDFAPEGLPWELLISSLVILTAIFLAIGSGYRLYRRKGEEKRSIAKKVKAKLSFFSDTYQILVSSISGIPIWSLSNISYTTDDTLEGTISGLSVGIDSFLESFQSDFMSTLTNYDLTKDHPDYDTDIRISIIEQREVKIMILGSASYRIFVFMKEAPSTYIREKFLEAIEDLQRRLPIEDLGFINENILGPNVRMVIRRHIPVGLLTPVKVDIERLNQLDSIQQQGLEDVHITKGGINTIKLLLIAARATELKNKNSTSLLRLYNKEDFAERYSGIFLFDDAYKILKMIPGLSIEDIGDAFWLGASEKVKILVPI
jgi:hypothetical protein